MLRRVGARSVAALAVLLAVVGAPRIASAWCRTTTSSDFVATPAKPCDLSGTPLWWHSRCVGFAVNKDASTQIDLPTARAVVQQQLDLWTSVDCPADPVACSGGGAGTPSMKVTDLGPTTVHAAAYNAKGGNENVILFWDTTWPHPDADVTLALTTVTYSVTSGEIYDADIEVNSNPTSNPLAAADPLGDRYDFQSIVAHESGHLLGLSHTQPANTDATMSSKYRRGDTFMRTRSADDACGICAVYPPKRAAVCDTTEPGGTVKSGCHCALAGGRASGADVSFGAAALALAIGVARRRRR